MARTAPAPADPLAHLRAAESEAATLPPSEPADAPELLKALAPFGYTDDATVRIVTAWHEDTVAVGILHRGGTCGCRYLARAALAQAVEELDPDDDAEGPDA